MKSRSCVFCGQKPTNEHVFRRAWRPRFADFSDDLSRIHLFEGAREVRPERAFQLQVKRACSTCNNGWMNALDSSVEDWVFTDARSRVGGPTPEKNTTITSWALKTAVMRALVDGATPDILASDFAAIKAGEVPQGWHVFAGNLAGRSLLHASVVATGPGRAHTPLGMLGLRQVSWALGDLVTVVFYSDSRLLDGREFMDMFRSEIEGFGRPLSELTRGETLTRKRLDPRELPSLFWWTYSIVGGTGAPTY